MPCAASATRDPEWGLVVEEVAVDLGADHADPGGHGEEGESARREAIAAVVGGRF